MTQDERFLHEKHRERMRNKYSQARDTLADHEILEILLYHAMPRKNTNHIAHKLCRHFGSLRGVLEADAQELMQIEGIGESTAFFLQQILYLWKRCEKADSPAVTLDSVSKLGDYLTALFSDESEEAVFLLMLDKNAQLIAARRVFDGELLATESHARKIAEIALAYKAPRIVVAHNHPEDSADPSDADVFNARYLRRVFLGIDLYLEELFIVSGKHYCPILHYLKETFQNKN